MSLTSSCVLLVLCVISYSVIIEIFTVLFRLTGLTKEKARTQVISMLTNSGFTTAESEIVLSSRRRRRLAQVTMLSGYFFTVVIVSIIVNMFFALSQTELKLLTVSVLLMVGFLALVIGIFRLPFIRARLDHLIERLGNRIMFGRESNTVVLLDIYGGKAMVEIFLDNLPDFLHDKPLSESGLKEQHDIQLLFVKRGGQTLDKINGDTILGSHDTIVIFGNYKNIRELFEHPTHTKQENKTK